MKKRKAFKVVAIILAVVFIFAGGFGAGTIVTVVKSTESSSIGAKVSVKLNYLKKVIDEYYLDYKDDKSETKVEDGVYKGLFEGLNDPYSVYYTKEEYKEMKEESSGTYYGIGVVVTQDAETGVISFVRVFEGGPGDKAGAKADDILYQVDGEGVTSKDLNDVVAKMKGDKNTKVKITVYRPSTKKYVDIEITRDSVDVPTVEHKMLDNKIGYVQIVEFDEVTYTQFKEAMVDLQKQGAKGYVFDVRSNPGGLYTIVCKILDEILPEGTIVYTEDKNGKKEEEKSDADCLNLPITVLQNNNSASAAEIFAGAIKDFNYGTIVGDTSFGKGIVQNIFPLTDGSAVKITIERYFTPSGVNIQGTGIEPDIKVEDNTETEKDEQLDKAIEVLNEKIK